MEAVKESKCYIVPYETLEESYVSRAHRETGKYLIWLMIPNAQGVVAMKIFRNRNNAYDRIDLGLRATVRVESSHSTMMKLSTFIVAS